VAVAVPTGTVTFLFTDIEGSTRLWDAAPDAMRAALARHEELLRSAIEEHAGYVFAVTGDGVAAAFQRSADAVTAAVKAQQSLTAEPWPAEAPLRVRMGLHTGEAEERDDNYFGAPLNRAARLMAAAHGGQVVVSEATAGLLKSPPGVELIDVGSHRLRGFVEPTRVFLVKADGMQWVDEPLATPEGSRGNLPRPETEWFGPVTELHLRVADLGRRRLVTLTGPGGVGKTRLALEMGGLAADEFPDGAWMVELAPVVARGSVLPAVAAALGVLPQAGLDTLGTILDWLGHRRLLLVLDNCEHVLEPVVTLVTAVFAAHPSVSVLATSREPLGVRGERVVPVPSLSDPDAVALFCDRAEAADAGLVYGPEDRATIKSICQRLDGIPLAIELAAARARALAPVDLLARLDDRFALLRGGERGGLERHQTLRATVAWSYYLLTDAQRLVFDLLSAFAGGFDLPAAEAVCGERLIDPADVVDEVAALVDKSLVIVVHREGAPARYRVLESLRQYGEERLADRGEVAAVRARHLDHYRVVARRACSEWLSPRHRDAAATFEVEWDNLRLAHSAALATGDLDAAEAIVDGVFDYAATTLREELGDWIAANIAAGEELGRVRPATYGQGAWVAYQGGEYRRAVALAQQGIDAAPAKDDPGAALCEAVFALAAVVGAADRAQARVQLEATMERLLDDVVAFRCCCALGVLLAVTDPKAAAPAFARARSIAERIGTPAVLSAINDYETASIATGERPDFRRALARYREGLEFARAAGSSWGIARNLAGIAACTIHLDGENADGAVHEALDYALEVRCRSGNVLVLLGEFAIHLAQHNEIERAALLLGYLAAHQPGIIALLRSQPRRKGPIDDIADEPEAQQWRSAGAAMDYDAVVRRALAHDSGNGVAKRTTSGTPT
jgi:predicted ATPase/class 3 adenylate cyclase